MNYTPATDKQIILLVALARAGFLQKGVAPEEVEQKIADWAVPLTAQGRAAVSEAISRGQATGLTPVFERVSASAPQESVQLQLVPSGAQVPEGPTTPALDLSELPEGRYAVPGGETRLKVQIDRPKTGRWAGWTFVRDAAEYGRGQRYGRQSPGGTYRGDIAEALAAIVSDPPAASAAYGHLVGRCGVCGRRLEHPDSVARGIGPVCAERLSW